MGRDMAKTLLEDVKVSAAESSTNEYYIGIGKSDVFNTSDSVIDPVDSPRDEREFRLNLQSIKKVEDAIFRRQASELVIWYNLLWMGRCN
jgi:hypothetical protein